MTDKIRCRLLFGMTLLGSVALASLLQRGVIQGEEPKAPKWDYAANLLRPFWEGDTVEGESILFIRNPETGEARGSLLFPVKQVLMVQNSEGTLRYEEGRDYQWRPDSRELVLPKDSRIVSHTPDDLRRPAGSQKYQLTHRDGNGEIFFGGQLEYHAMQTCITYTHNPADWKGAVPKFAEKQLPETIRKLRDRQELTIVLLGDSISSGCNASGWAQGAPFQPPYQDLLQQHLEASTGAQVSLKNLSVGGRDSAWGLTMVDEVARAEPDLVLIAFGMNDSAGRLPDEFRANIASTIAKIREPRPKCEFILIATMLGNRDWTRLKHEYFSQYRNGLASLTGSGVALADLTSIWTEFLQRKQDWDLTGNGVNHPNDFGHRVYAQVLATLLVPPAAP